MHWAVIRASSQPGPSGSVGEQMSVRDGCRPVSRAMVAAQCSPSSGRRAMTTRLSTLVRAATWRPSAPSTVVTRSGTAQILASSRSIPSIVVARDVQRRPGSPGLARPRALRSDPSPAPAVALHAARRPPPGPRTRPRSSGSRAPASSSQASMIGVTMPHASSTSSARVNSEASPRSASRMSVS